MSSRLGIPLTKDMGKYLGFHLRHHGASKNTHLELLQAMRNTLTGWKSKCLSRAGRITLTKSVLNAIPTFQMQLQKLPASVHKEMGRMSRECIRGDDKQQRKIHMISWQSICKPKANGGLGLRRASDMNKAMLAKLNWRLLIEDEDKLWVRLMRRKYNTYLLLMTRTTISQGGSYIWRALTWSKDLLLKGICWRVLNGRKSNLWKDKWLEDTPLQSLALSPIAENKLLCKVSYYWSDERGWKWEEIGNLLPSSTLLRLASTIISSNMDDKDQMGWKETENGVFSVKSAHALEAGWNKQHQWRGWMLVWRLQVQERVKTFLWMMAHERILTNEARHKSGLALSADYGRCLHGKEDVMHNIRGLIVHWRYGSELFH